MIAAVKVVDPGRTALQGAVRVAIVQPAAFALAFAGSAAAAARLLAHLALAAAGTVLIAARHPLLGIDRAVAIAWASRYLAMLEALEAGVASAAATIGSPGTPAGRG